MWYNLEQHILLLKVSDMQNFFRPVSESIVKIPSPTTVAHNNSPNCALPTLAGILEKHSQAANSVVTDQKDENNTITMFELYEPHLCEIDREIHKYRNKLRKSKLYLQIAQLTQQQRSYLINFLDETPKLMLEFASKLELPAIEIEKFLKENEGQLNEQQVFFLRSNVTFRHWLVNIFKNESSGSHLNDKIKTFFEDSTIDHADYVTKCENKILRYNEKILEKNREASAFIGTVRHGIEGSNAKTLRNFGKIFEEFEEDIKCYKASLREDLTPSATKDLMRLSKYEDLLSANRNYFERIRDLDERDSFEETSEGDWGQFSSINDNCSSLIVSKSIGDIVVTISNPSILQYLLLSGEKADIGVKQIYESPRSANFLGLKF